MPKLHASLKDIPMPWRIAALPLTEAGWPELFFADKLDGKIDLRTMDYRKWVRCIKEKRCWVCGQPLGVYLVWPIGPMCAINRVSAEPPSHRQCAEYAMRACPFLSRPHMERRPIEGSKMSGVGILRNPGAAALWVAKSYKVFDAHNGGGGQLIHLGEPIEVKWYSAGRAATPQEVWESIDSGLPILREGAEKEGPESMRALDKQIEYARAILPPRPEGLLDV